MDTATSESGDPHVTATPGEETAGEAEAVVDDLQHTSLPLDSLIRNGYNYGLFVFSNYGWYILFSIVVLIIAWSYIKPYFLKWKKTMEQRTEEQNYDPVKAEHFQDSMMRAREKMQRELDQRAAEQQEKVEKRKEEERDDRIKQWEEFKVVTRTQKSKPKNDHLQRSRRDFFPLDGGGRSGGFRAARRSFGGGGG